jgi:membrane protease YdiL (CAAX protease family)
MDRDSFFQLLSGLVVLYVTIGMPLVSRWRFRRFNQQIAAGLPGARVSFYRTIVTQHVIITASLLGLFWLGRAPPADVGLGEPRSWMGIGIAAAAIVVICVLSGLQMRAKADVVLPKLREKMGAVIPGSPTEARWFAWLASGGAIQEELLYRAFLFYYLGTHFPDLSVWMIILISSAVFGLGHLYQGVKGILLTGLAGVLVAGLYVASGNLILPILLHALLNLRILFLVSPPPKSG